MYLFTKLQNLEKPIKIGFIGNEDKNCNTIFQSQLQNIIDFLKIGIFILAALPLVPEILCSKLKSTLLHNILKP